MVLADDEIDKIKLMLIDNNKVLISELNDVFVSKYTFYKVSIGLLVGLIGMLSPQLINLIQIFLK